jgi:hypothetical protein
LEKEEQWLNRLLQEGWILSKKNVRYEFIESNDKSGSIKIDYRTFKTKKDLVDYILLFEDSGWEHVAGDKNSGKHYFIKTDNNADLEIFSDQRSKAERYKRMADVWFNLAIAYFPIAVTLYLTKFVEFKSLFNPQSLYLTPGLWEMTGNTFWKAFIFETPFALARGLVWIVFPILIILYIIFAIRAHTQYKKSVS